MDTDALGVVFAVAGFAVGIVLGDSTTAVLAAIFGFFGGKVTDSLTRTLGVE